MTMTNNGCGGYEGRVTRRQWNDGQEDASHQERQGQRPLPPRPRLPARNHGGVVLLQEDLFSPSPRGSVGGTDIVDPLSTRSYNNNMVLLWAGGGTDTNPSSLSGGETQQDSIDAVRKILNDVIEIVEGSLADGEFGVSKSSSSSSFQQ